jgi:hypothetical protein
MQKVGQTRDTCARRPLAHDGGKKEGRKVKRSPARLVLLDFLWLAAARSDVCMDSEVITKRLHISGLTPALTIDDLSRRLGSYGLVKALDGFGKLDGLGQPRKYGYITLEAKASQIQKCAFNHDLFAAETLTCRRQV